MSRKKINPARIPVNINEAEARKLVEEKSSQMLLCSWALVLGALADWRGTTAEGLLEFCEAVNGKSTKLRDRKSAEAQLAVLKDLTGLTFPFHSLPVTDLHTKRDVGRLLQKVDENAIHSAFALIADVLLTHNVMPEADVRRLFLKAHKLKEELFEKRISFQDIQGVLKDEFGLQLAMEGSSVFLQYIG